MFSKLNLERFASRPEAQVDKEAAQEKVRTGSGSDRVDCGLFLDQSPRNYPGRDRLSFLTKGCCLTRSLPLPVLTC